MLLYKNSGLFLPFSACVLIDDVINMDEIPKILKIVIFLSIFRGFSLKLVMAAFVFVQNIYIYDVSNKYTQHVTKFSLNMDATTTNRAKNW